MRTITRTIASAVIISSDNKILLGKKDPHSGGVYLDFWLIPGGGVEAGETIEQTLYREIQEEVGIDIQALPILLLENTNIGTTEKTDKNTGERYLCEMHFHTYRVDLPVVADKIQVILSDDLVQYQWIDKKVLPSVKLSPPSLKLFAKLGWIPKQKQ